MCSSLPMSTSPEDRIVGLLSRWLARHLDNTELREGIAAAGREGLSEEQAVAVGELVAELDRAGPTDRGGVEMVVRETLEALALG
jgi:hypothetical protein